MSLKPVHAPHLGRTIKLGGRKRSPVAPRLHLGSYLRDRLPPAPPGCDYRPKAAASLSNVYLNDQLGDCVIAGGYHVVGVATGNATGLPFVASESQIVADYHAIGGYEPGDPSTDDGCNEQEALRFWSTQGFQNGTKLAGWAAVNARNAEELRSALFLFENLYLGIELPDAWVNPMPAGPGFTWDVAGEPDPDNGHCVMAAGYDDKGVQIDTWGITGTLTWAALARYCVRSAGGEAYVLLTPDQIARGQTRAPNGVCWEELEKDIEALR